MADIALVIAEHHQNEVNLSTYKAVAAATLLTSAVHVLVLGHECENVAAQIAAVEGVKEVFIFDDKTLAHPLAERMCEMVLQLDNIKYYIAPATTFGKNLMPRIAAKLDVAQISDVIKIIDTETFERPIYAGNAIATVKSLDPIKVLTVRPTAFPEPKKQTQLAPIKKLTLNAPAEKQSEFVSAELTKSSRPDLATAKIVVSGGRGLQNKENFKLLEPLAEVLNAAIGASRAAVDAGFVPNDYQVGQTGKVVAPELYIAIGISGAIQHLAGMKDSKVIVAVNQDADAPIFQIADYSIVADLFEAIPKLTEVLKNKS